MQKLFFSLLVISLASCSSSTQGNIPTQPQSQPSTQEAAVTLQISSPAFKNGEAIPSDFSCDGRDVSPALAWTEAPAGTQSFAIIMDDPDAPVGIWVHWVIFNIPASTRDLKEGTPTDPQLSDGSIQGQASSGSSGYHGPCPPSGTHRYFFKLYALDSMLSLTASADKKDLLAAMEGHILASAELMGTFKH